MATLEQAHLPCARGQGGCFTAGQTYRLVTWVAVRGVGDDTLIVLAAMSFLSGLIVDNCFSARLGFHAPNLGYSILWPSLQTRTGKGVARRASRPTLWQNQDLNPTPVLSSALLLGGAQGSSPSCMAVASKRPGSAWPRREGKDSEALVQDPELHSALPSPASMFCPCFHSTWNI